MVNQVFLIQEPKPGDTRERNAFGILKGFGKAAAEYYAQRDKNKEKNMPTNNEERETIAVVWRNKDLRFFLPMAGRQVDNALLHVAIYAALERLHPDTDHDVHHDEQSWDYTHATISMATRQGDGGLDEQPIWDAVEESIDTWAPRT